MKKKNRKETKREKNNLFSVMADECADCSNQAQLSICILYCYTENDVCYVTEDFCGFVKLVKANAETISTCILNKLREWGFDLTRLRGQGNDGCSTMSGEVSGVQTIIIQELPNVKYARPSSFITDFIICLRLLDALMNYVIFPKIVIKFLTSATD
jgi:hypothetical protein